MPEAYAVCREAAHRSLGQRHYDVQLIGGIVLHQGKIAEMKTGEGKTLTATLPCYLHGISGKGAHVITVNDYLAKRDAEWMNTVYSFLGLTTGTITHGMGDKERRAGYQADITYGTNNEFGFDYLRDNMKTELDQFVQRGHDFAIVDEVDSILIDEARTPLIISGPAESNSKLYGLVNNAIPGLQKDSDYLVDEKGRSVSLTDDGISKLEKRLRVKNLYKVENIEYLHHCQQALKAHVIFKKDVDYVVRDGEIIIVDEFTGRLMPGRRYSDGLHGALEAKEHVEIQQETQTLATITYQNYFRLYKTLSGMTGTADTEAVEFSKIYKLEVVVIPTNRPLQRVDEMDEVYADPKSKFAAIADEISEHQKKGQPVLVGTISVEKSELLSNLLVNRNIKHSILNAKNHAGEATIIANAGKMGNVTISTNMAGRGTDIQLGEGVREKGGLYVIGTERHESRRIDNQLRGRSGRQGDPGKSKFFISLQDDLVRLFASEKTISRMSGAFEDGKPIVSRMISSSIETAQRRVEEHNFSSRKHVLEYDDVMSQQRQVIYGKRLQALSGQFTINFLDSAILGAVHDIVANLSPLALDSEKWDLPNIEKSLQAKFKAKVNLKTLNTEVLNDESISQEACKQLLTQYREAVANADPEEFKKIENLIYLNSIDQAWKEHLLAMDSLKDSVSLRGYGQRDPLQEYKREAFILFETMIANVEEGVAISLLSLPLALESVTMEKVEPAPFTIEELDPDEIVEISTEKETEEPQLEQILEGLVEKSRQKQNSSSNLSYSGGKAPEAAVKKDDAPAPTTFRREGEKIGRNAPCPCGSGKKYKKCHGAIGSQPTVEK